MAADFTELEKRCIEKLAAPAGDAAHDLAHVRRVVRNAQALAAAERARLEVVLPAAWLHDCVTVPKDSSRRAEASRLAAAQATKWLGECPCACARGKRNRGKRGIAPPRMRA